MYLVSGSCLAFRGIDLNSYLKGDPLCSLLMGLNTLRELLISPAPTPDLLRLALLIDF